MLRQGEFTMSEQAVEERRGWASDIMWVALRSIRLKVTAVPG